MPIESEELQQRKNRTIIWLAEEVRRLRELAFKDPLTQVENRRGLEERRRNQDPAGPFTLLLLDIDHFKRVNDTYGHAAGDTVLVKFAQELKRRVRAGDIVCRYGGEEFLIVFQETDPANIMRKFRLPEGEKPYGQLHLSVELDGGRALDLTASGGLTRLEKDEELPQAIARADKALYQAKESGRDRILLA